MFKRLLLAGAALMSFGTLPMRAAEPQPYRERRFARWGKKGKFRQHLVIRKTYRVLIALIQRERQIGVDPVYANSYVIPGRAARVATSKAWRVANNMKPRRYA